jgi:hypothetical protein
VSAYGFSKTSDKDRAELRTAIEENLKREVGEQLERKQMLRLHERKKRSDAFKVSLIN